jgi:hypothetical protein
MSYGVVYWYDLVTLKRKGSGHEHKHEQHDVVVCMPDNKCVVRCTNSTVLTAGGGLRIVDRSTFRPSDIIA